MADKEESYLRQYMKEVRQKRLDTQRAQGMELRATGVNALKDLNRKVDGPVSASPVGSGADSGQRVPKANDEGKFERSDVKRGLEAQKNVAATRDSARQIQGAVAKQGHDVAGAIQQLGLRLEDAMFRANNRLIKAIGGIQGGGGRGLFGSGGGPDIGGGGNNKKGPSKWGNRLRVAGGLALGGAGGYVAGKSISRMLGASEEASDWIGAAGGVAGAAGGAILTSEGGLKGAGRAAKGAGKYIARGGKALGVGGGLALAGGGLAAYNSYNNAGVLADDKANTVDKIRAGSQLALTGAGAYIGGTLGGVKGAAMGAAAGGFAGDAAEWVGDAFNNVITGTKFGDMFQNAVGTTFDTLLSPFSEEARTRLGQTFDSTIASAKDVASDIAGYVGVGATAISGAAATASTVIRNGVTTAEELAAKLPRLDEGMAKIGSLAATASGVAATAISDGFEGASSLFSKDITNSLAPSLTAAATLIGDSVTTFKGWFSDWGSTFENLKNSLANNFEDFKNGASLFARSTWAGLNAGANKVKEAAVQGYEKGSGGGGGGSTGAGAGPIGSKDKPSTSMPSAGQLPAGVTAMSGVGGGVKPIDTDLLNAASDAANAVQAGPIGSRDRGMTGKELANAKAEAAQRVLTAGGVNAQGQKIAAEPGVLQRAMNVAKGVAGATTSVAGAIPNAAATARDTAMSAGAGEGAKQMGQAIMNTVGDATKGLRSKHDFAGIKGGDMLKSHGSYTADEAQKIRDLKTSGANTSANLAGGMPAETRDKIIAAAYASGQDPKTMLKMAAMESGGNKDAVSMTGATGIYQFTGQTASGVGIKDRFNEDQNIAGGMKLTAANKASLEKSGLPVTAENLYMMHQLGPGAAKEVIAGARDGKSKGDLSASTQNAMNLNYGKNSATAKDYLATNAKALDDRYNKVVNGGDQAIAGMGAKTTVAGAPIGSKDKPSTEAPLGTITAKAAADTAKKGELKGTQVASMPGAPGSKDGVKAATDAAAKASAQGPQRQAIAQDLNPGMFKPTMTAPDAAMKASAKPVAGSVAANKSYHVSPIAQRAGEQSAQVAELAKARPTEFERIKEKPQIAQVEVANLPDPAEQQAGGGSGGTQMVPGKSSPYLDEIPLMITDMGLVLMQMGHT